METEQKKIRKIRIWTILFMISLIISGITAFPIETELKLLSNLSFPAPISSWIDNVYTAVSVTNKNYPYLSYGTDWLAFSHLVIAVAFIGVLKDPLRNIWILQFGMIACVMIFPLAFIAGNYRGIPFYWQLIDCSFGVIGFIPLYIAYITTKSLTNKDQTWYWV